MKSIYTAVLIAIMGVGLLMIGCGPTPPEPTDLVGDYVSTCWESDPDAEYPNTNMTLTTYTTTHRSSEWTTYIPEDLEAEPPVEACSYATYKVDSYHSYTIAGQDPDLDITQMDYTAVSIDLTVLDQASLDIFNLIVVCGFSDWELNVPKDITGATCTGSYTADVGETTLETMKINLDASPVTYQSSAPGIVGAPRDTVITDVVQTRQ
jgi:hypothetical protein